MPRNPNADGSYIGIVACRGCESPNQLVRALHLMKFPSDKSLAGHLHEQHGDDFEKSGGINAALVWLGAIRRLYGEGVDDDGTPLPLWKAYLKAHGKLPANHREIDARKKEGEVPF